ncbi:MAG: N-acetylmuramoyl-L-alanine amidase, partial [Tateyamaria sp.]
MRAVLIAVMMWAFCAGAWAQDLSGLARVDGAETRIEDNWLGGGVTVTLGLSQGVPYRVFVLDDPARLVADFREVDFSGISPDVLLPEPGEVTAVRFGTFKPGWSRLVADLARPMLPDQVEMRTDTASGTAVLQVRMTPASAEAFADQTGGPRDPDWGVEAAAPPAVRADDAFVVVIDPGHGGIDPGAVRETTSEKELMLGIGLALRDALRRA